MTYPEDQKAPKIFVSYSHDTPAHKKWVGELASKLVEKGIDVILDQWDLAPGDDIPKFMENSVGISDRVLIICTELYVRKADEGEGGVGYEAMIVTGELVRNLGTSKFIPVIGQTGDNTFLPKSLSTRFYVNLSDGQVFDEQFDLLLRELHKVPVLRKPPLGKNPFARQPSGTEIPSIPSKVGLIPDITKLLDNISSVYRTAFEVARDGDFVTWRRIIRQANSSITEQLKAWRQKYEPGPPQDIEGLSKIALEGANIYAPIFSIALAGVESGREKFSDQVGLIDEILNPRDWEWSGITTIADLPETIAYMYQALNGAMCLQTGQLT